MLMWCKHGRELAEISVLVFVTLTPHSNNHVCTCETVTLLDQANVASFYQKHNGKIHIPRSCPIVKPSSDFPQMRGGYFEMTGF